MLFFCFAQSCIFVHDSVVSRHRWVSLNDVICILFLVLGCQGPIYAAKSQALGEYDFMYFDAFGDIELYVMSLQLWFWISSFVQRGVGWRLSRKMMSLIKTKEMLDTGERQVKGFSQAWVIAEWRTNQTSESLLERGRWACLRRNTDEKVSQLTWYLQGSAGWNSESQAVDLWPLPVSVSEWPSEICLQGLHFRGPHVSPTVPVKRKSLFICTLLILDLVSISPSTTSVRHCIPWTV